MSYSKKDEDADQAIVKVDRTAVFQEGKPSPLTVPPTTDRAKSTLVQLFTHLTSKMSHTAHKDRLTPVHRGELPPKRSDGSLLRHLEALSEQRSFATTDDVSHL